MILVPNLRPLSNGNKLFVLLLSVLLLSSSCAWFQKVQDPESPTNEGDELDEIQGKRKYNPETGQYEYETAVTEEMDTIRWSDGSRFGPPPIPTGEVPSNPNAPTPAPDGSLGTVFNPTYNVESPKYGSYNVAMILPFLTNQFDGTRNSLPKNSNWALSYYAGAKMAFDRLNEDGINLNISVYDTKANEAGTRALLSNADLINANLIIGPYRSKNAQIVANFARNNKIPMVSPYSASLTVTERNPYYIQVNPSLRSHCEALTRHFRSKYTADQIVLLARNKPAETTALKYFQDANYAFEGTTATDRLKEVTLSDDSADFINEEDFSLYIQPGKTTVFVIPSWQNESYVYNLLRKINVSKGPNNVVVYGMPQWMGFERISPDYYERLKVHISSASFIDPGSSEIRFFRQDYYNKFGTVPSAEAFLGYDTVLYFGRMIEKHGANFQYFIDQEADQYLHTKFSFEPVVNPTTTGAENFSDIERFENKFVNVLKFERYRFQLSEETE